MSDDDAPKDTIINYVIGPFTKDNFQQHKWKSVKEKIYHLNSANEEETIPYCQDLLQLLLELNSSPDYNQYFGEPVIKQFFFQEIFGSTAKDLIATRSFHNSNLLEISNACLLNMVIFWTKAFKEDSPHLVDMAKNILDPSKYYYKCNDQEFFSPSSVPSFLKEATPEHLEWIKTLKEGDLVDCIKEDSICHKMCWLPAKVTYVMDSFLRISFLHDYERTNRYINKVSNANEIATYKTKCTDFEWRTQLKEDDEVDVCNPSSNWRTGYVLDTRESQTDSEYPVKEVKIGYKANDSSDGNKDDSDKGYDWSTDFDEWFVITNPRLARKGTMVKKVPLKSSFNEEILIDDYNDKVYNVNGEKIYALTRQMYCKSTFMVKMINTFGELGGFTMILNRISDTENWAPIELVTLLLGVLGNISTTFHRDFAQEYIPALKHAVWKNVLQSPDSNIRNFTKERLDDILQSLDHLFKRVYLPSERHELLETLNLKVCAMCFDSNFLERKLQGLKSLLEMIKCLRLNNLKHTTTESLNKFIKENRIFEKIYGSKGHIQLIQRSAEFLKYIVSENNLEISELESVWNATKKGDTETKLAVYKLFSDISLYFKEEHLDLLIAKISEIEPSEFISDEIELVYELSRFSSKPSMFANKARHFFWKILQDNSGSYAPDIVETTLTKFCYIMRSWELREERVSVLYDCVDNISKGVSVLSSLKILKKIIENYPINSTPIEKFTKTSCTQHLLQEKDLLNVVLDDLLQFKSNIRKKLGPQSYSSGISDQALDQLAGEHTSYINHITERLQFIHFIVSNTGAKEGGLTYELLCRLWDIVVREALVPSERNAIYKWVKETAESRGGFSMPMQDLVSFFKMKMVTKEDYQVMTNEGFESFKSVFLLVNEKLGGLSKNSTSYGSSSYGSYGSSYGPVYGPNYYSYDDDDKNGEKEFQYKVNISPEELEGVQSVWDLALSSKNEEVAEKARNFINELYSHLNNELQEKISAIREQYLNKCIDSLKETLSQKDNESKDFSASTNKCARCLFLINKILDESEKKGVGSLKSHSALIKGEYLTFSVANEISWGSDVPRKIEIRMHSNVTIYELRVKISEHFKVTWDQVKLCRSQQRELKDNDNGKTLGDIRIRNGEELTASKRPTKPIPQADLVDSDGNLNPTAKKIFIEWFKEHSEDGKMNIDQCAAFIDSCTNDGCRADDRRVKEVFAKNDHDNDGFLSLEDFLDFYTVSCRIRPQVVWNNLHSHHYRNDLKKASEVEEERVNITELPRYILSSIPEYFQLLFSLLDYGGKVAVEAWKLLNRLPTSPQIFTDIVKLEGIRIAPETEKNWKRILDPTSSYKLLYSLQVIEYLMEDETESENLGGENEQNHLFWAKDPELVEYRKNWQTDFIFYRGFDYLFKIFNNFAAKNHSTLGTFDKNILSFILKILSNYLTATFASTVSNIYRCLSLIRFFHLDLNFIQKYIANEQKKNAENFSSNTVEGSETNIAVHPVPDAMRQDSNVPKGDDKNKENLKIEEPQEFKALVERLKSELGTHILATIDLKEMIKVISELGCDVLAQTGELESEDRMILEYSVSILTSIFLYDNQSIKYFLSLNEKKDNVSDKLMLRGIFCPQSFNVRNYFSHAVYIICKYTHNYENSLSAKYFIKLFLSNLPTSKDNTKEDCNQYFEVLCKLIEETYSSATPAIAEETLNFEELIQMVAKQIKDHTSSEDHRNFHVVDKAFTGLLQLCDKLVGVKPELKDLVGSKEGCNLIQELFDVCLFNTKGASADFGDLIDGKDSTGSSPELVKCKSKESRHAAYQLLLTLCKGYPPNLMLLLKSLEGLMGSIMGLGANQDWNYSPSSDTKSLYGYVGIKNLRCICYMNAMLQQFFMTPTFRYGILAADDKEQPKWAKNEEGMMIDDNVLHQLQQMFGFLELSDRQDYNPFEFCFSFKDHSGQPVNVSVQQDTQEFLNMIFDKLENGLKKTPFKHILQGVYGGKTSNQTICHGCGSISEREDIFYNLSVEVKNMKTIYDSFEKFITGEIIEDFYCDNCKSKNNITKRTCLSALPNVLIVHLQRIVFDLDTLMNQKINSRLEFPFELNVEPYTREALEKKDKDKKKGKKGGQNSEGLENQSEDKEKKIDDEEEVEAVKAKKNESENADEESATDKKESKEQAERDKEYYTYKLAGVLVHDGTAEFGHYYSYINTNREDLSTQGKGFSDKDKWLEFNDSIIKSFNIKNIESECFGGEVTDSTDDYWSYGRYGSENSKNAYILVYERVLKGPLELVVTTPEEEGYLNRILDIEEVQKKEPKAIKITKQEVSKENEEKQVVTNYHCDYYMLKKFVPGSIYKKVWEDNNKFMFERHVYSDDFFNFIKEVCSSLQLPEPNPEVYTIINPLHTTLSTETKQNIQNLIPILSRLIFCLLARAQENNMIGSLTTVLKNMISLVPEAAYTFFEATVIKDTKNLFSLLLTCPDKNVRYYTSQLVLLSINVMITQYNFTLSKERLEEKCKELDKMTAEEKNLLEMENSIIKFLELLIASLPTEVAKNWTKLAQYFEFWRDFGNSGEAQIRFLFEKEFIAVLIDFFLDKKSPLVGFSEKKHTLGNRYVEPEFYALIHTIVLMARRAKVVTKSGAIPYNSRYHQGFSLFELSENDRKCITCPDFYEKMLKDKYDYQSVGTIIQLFCLENENLSYSLAGIIVYGLSKANYEDAKPYLEAMSYLITLVDNIQMHRLEWILGFPQPMLTTMRVGYDSFGLYGNYSLDDVVINYETPLNVNGGTSIINIMLQNRKRFENMTMVCLRQILLLADLSDVILKYLLSLPPPSYNYAKFTDWIPGFIDYFLEESKKCYYSNYPKEELGIEGQKYWRLLEVKINQRLETHEKELAQTLAGQDLGETLSTNVTEAYNTDGSPVVDNEASENELLEKERPNHPVLKGFFNNYIIGRTYKFEEVDKIVYSQQDPYEISIRTSEVYCYITDSKPTGLSNLAFPNAILDDCTIKSYEVKHDSPLALFLQGRQAQSNIDSHKSIQNVLQNDIEAALAQASDSTTSGSPNQNWRNQESNVEIEVNTNNIKGASQNQENGNEGTEGRRESHESPKPVKLHDRPHDKFVEIERNIPMEQDFEFNYEVNPVIRRIYLRNDSPYNLNCQLRIVPKTTGFMNFRIPISYFSVSVRAHSNTCVATLMKIFPQFGWGEYEIRYYIQIPEGEGGSRYEPEEGRKKNIQIRTIDANKKREVFTHNRLQDLLSFTN